MKFSWQNSRLFLFATFPFPPAPLNIPFPFCSTLYSSPSHTSLPHIHLFPLQTCRRSATPRSALTRSLWWWMSASTWAPTLCPGAELVTPAEGWEATWPLLPYYTPSGHSSPKIEKVNSLFLNCNLSVNGSKLSFPTLRCTNYIFSPLVYGTKQFWTLIGLGCLPAHLAVPLFSLDSSYRRPFESPTTHSHPFSHICITDKIISNLLSENITYQTATMNALYSKASTIKL